MNGSSPPLPPPPDRGRRTKLDCIRYAFYLHRDVTPISITDAWEQWPEMREVHPSFDAFRVNVYRLNGTGDRHHLYAIGEQRYRTYLVNMSGLLYLFQRGYISKEEENRARKWLCFTLPDVMDEKRADKIIRSTKHGYRSWTR